MPEKAAAGHSHRTAADKVMLVLAWTFMGIGIFLRIYHFFLNRSLWVDEIYLVTSIIRMDFLDLATPPLDYQQKAPLGFLWLVRLCVLLFGSGEMSLRLVPLLSGIASLVLFLPLARTYLKPVGVMIAMGMLAFAPPLVYHSVEIKQYATEMFATVLALYLYTKFENKYDTRSLLLWGLYGIIMVWFSYTVIFLLAGIAGGVCLYLLVKKEWTHFFRSLLPFSLWMVSFLVNYLLITNKHADSAWLIDWFRVRDGFLPENVSFSEGGNWLLQSFYRMLEYPLGVMWNANVLNNFDNPVLRIIPKMPVLLFLCWGAGMFFLIKRNLKVLFVLSLPILLTLVATLLELYPFYERLLVFLAPLPVLLIALGCEKLMSVAPARAKWKYIIPVLVLFWPLRSSALQVVDPDQFGDYKMSYYRDALLYVEEHMKEGDVVYVYWNARHAYRFYKVTHDLKYEAVELKDYRMVSGSSTDYIQHFTPYLEAAEGKRVWFVYERFLNLDIGDYDGYPVWYHNEGRGAKLLLKTMGSRAEGTEAFIGSNIGVSLFDFSATPVAADGRQKETGQQ